MSLARILAVLTLIVAPALWSRPARGQSMPGVGSEPSPAFTYDLYSDRLGRFSFDGAALALVTRPSHLQRVATDAERGDPRARQLILELEYWFGQSGIALADRAAGLKCRVLPEIQPDCLPPNWGFLDQLLGSTPVATRLKEALAEAYARQARRLGVRDNVIVHAVNLLLAGSLASGVLARVGLPEAAAVADQPPVPTRIGVQANKAAGDAWSQAVGDELRATHEVVVPEITVRTRNGVKTRLDWVTKDSAGAIGRVECKASATAPLSPNQALAHPEIGQTGAVVVGKGKPGAPGGTVIAPTPVQVRRP